MRYRGWVLLFLMILFSGSSGFSKEKKHVIKTPEGKLIIKTLGHASLLFQFQGITIYCDPVFSQQANRPKADIVCLTHDHYDHFNLKSISSVSTQSTRFVCNEQLAGKLENSVVLKNGEKTTISGISIEAVPSYNLNPRFNGDMPYHPKGIGNGYLLRIGQLLIYVAGDTDLIPEMSFLPKIEIAFLPVMAPYTMGYEKFVEAVKIIQPDRVYPYHTGITDLEKLPKTIATEKDIEVVIL